jgi:hypothetical protein
LSETTTQSPSHDDANDGNDFPHGYDDYRRDGPPQSSRFDIAFNQGADDVLNYNQSPSKNPTDLIFQNVKLNTTGGAEGHATEIVLNISNPSATMSFTLADAEVAERFHIQLSFDPATGDITFQYTGRDAGPSDEIWQQVLSGLQYTNSADEPLHTDHVISFVSALSDGGAYASIRSSGTETIETTCFYAGTRIATPTGEVAVETLRPGDLVLTADGRAMRVNWLGRQTVSLVFASKLRALPIRIKAGALGEGAPARDLLVSPDHAMFLHGLLIHAGALVNGTSVVRETDVPQVFVYYHVELDEHALLLAEGAPCESFVDNVDRLGFDNWDEFLALYPNGKTVEEMPYPRAKSHRQTPAAVRAALAERARCIGAAAAAPAA